MTQQILLCVCARACVCVCACVCERERDWQTDSCSEKVWKFHCVWCVWVCVLCVCVCVCVCKVMPERRGEGKGGGCKCWSSMVKVHWPAQLRSFPAPPPYRHFNHHLPLPFLEAGHGCGCQISSAEWRYRAVELWPEMEKASTRLPKLFELSWQWQALWTLPTVATSETGFFVCLLLFFFCFVGDFSKKAENDF